MKYIHGDPCPDCGKPMVLEEGEPDTREDPGFPAAVFCPDCGVDHDVDWGRHKFVDEDN